MDGLIAQLKSLRKEISDNDLAQALDALIADLNEISKKLAEKDLTVEDLLQLSGSLRTVAKNVNALLEKIELTMPEGTLPSIQQLQDVIQGIYGSLDDLSGVLDAVPNILAGLEDAYATMTQAQLEAAVGFATASAQLSAAESQLTAARQQYETAREEALSQANLDQLLNINTLSQLIYAQNFSMPAGYIDDANDNSWLLKVGEAYQSAEDISNTLLVSMAGIGQVRICDVATVTIIDNAGESYARLNG